VTIKILTSILLVTDLYSSSYNVQETAGAYIVSADKESMVVLKLYAHNNGYAQVDKTPSGCGTVYLLDSKGKKLGKIMKGYSSINKEVKRGKLSIMIVPEKKCKVSFNIPD